jgi:type II secretory pathway pseudopilin PulG
MELLTVIAIIAVLAGLLFPALTAARRAAKEGKAKVQINQLATAFRSYYNEYALWPTNGSITSTAIWLGILQGTDTTNNPRKIVFMEFKSSESSYNGVAGIYDPWNQNYNLGFDTNYDNTIDIPSSASLPSGASTNTSFLIWSTGDPKKPNTIGSWK